MCYMHIPGLCACAYVCVFAPAHDVMEKKTVVSRFAAAKKRPFARRGINFDQPAALVVTRIFFLCTFPQAARAAKARVVVANTRGIK